MSRARGLALHFEQCVTCRGSGKMQVQVTCPKCDGNGSITFPLASASLAVLAAYQEFLERDDGLDILRDALTDLREAIPPRLLTKAEL